MSKFIIFILAIGILYYLMKGEKRHKKVEHIDKGTQEPGEDLVLDPHCQTYVPKDGAYRLRSGEKVYYFCSTECREKYLSKLKT